jgi:hypothetical protein
MEGFGSFSMQGVSVNARHFFGVNTSVKDSLFLVGDDNTLVYIAGHNVVLYKLDEKEQYFLPGRPQTPILKLLSPICVSCRFK